MCETLNNELEKVSKWLIANKLSVNIKKTNYLILKTKQRKVAYKREAIRINNEILELKPSIKFLGVLIDENFDWKEHVNAVANKISKSIGIIYR